MKERLIGLIKTYILFVCIFILQKPLFILYYSSLYAGTSWTDPFKVIWNGLPLDLSLAGYLTASERLRGKPFQITLKGSVQEVPAYKEL